MKFNKCKIYINQMIPNILTFLQTKLIMFNMFW